jgi:hypothetical protein
MDHLVDDATRILASKMPRRKAFGMLWKLFAGAVLAGAVATPVAAQRGGGCTTNPNTCAGNQQCCPGATPSTNHCEPKPKKCCGPTSCSAGYCCSSSGSCAASTGPC